MRLAPDLPPVAQRDAIAAHCGLSRLSVSRAYRGAGGAGVRARVTLAALDLGLDPPRTRKRRIRTREATAP